MLTQAFNEQVDFQAEAQAILREKTLEHEQHHFNHTLKGHDFVISRNAAIGVADGGKLAFKKDEQFRKIFDHINRLHQIMKDAQAMMDSIYADIQEFQDSVDRQNRLREYKENGDIDKLREMYINEYDIDAEDVANMSDEEVLTQADKLDEVEQSKQDMLIESIKLKIQHFEQFIENGNLPDDQKKRLQQQLDEIKQKAQEDTDLDYHGAYSKAHESDMENGELYKIGRENEASTDNIEVNKETTNEEQSIITPPSSPSGFDF